MTAGDRSPSGQPPLPGDCVSIPQLRARVRDLHGDPRWEVATHVVDGLDLDGCGSPVILVPQEAPDLTEASIRWRLFVQRGDCGHELGIISGMDDPALHHGLSHGLRDLHVVSAAAPAVADDGLQGVASTVYRFDGRRYVPGPTRIR